MRGPLGTYEPTGKTITNGGMAFFEVKDGQVVRAWLETDRLGFLQQVGAVKL